MRIAAAVRSLGRAPGFTFTALLALALGIGSATTVFSVADRVLFRPLPFGDADRLVTIGGDVRSRGFRDWALAADEARAWQQAGRTIAEICGWQTFGRFTLSLPDAPVEVAVNRISLNFLDVLRIAPAIGRPLTDADFVYGAPPAMYVTDRAWRLYFASDPGVVGRFFTVNGAPAEVAGILPASFVFPSGTVRGPDAAIPDLLVPLVTKPGSPQPRVSVIGRLAAGATLDAARTEMDAIAAVRRPDAGLRGDTRVDGASVLSFLDPNVLGGSRFLPRLLLGAVGALLLIGCVNVANLLLARGADRQGELAVRTALGASRGSLVRMLLLESSLVAVAGGAAGVFIAYLATGTIGGLLPADLQRFGAIAVDARALLFAAGASALVVVLAGVGPALTAARANLSPALTQSSGRTTGLRWRIRQILVGVEVALAVVLLIGGGLMVNSMARVLGIRTGYDTDSVLTMRVQLPRGKEYPQRSKEFVERALGAARGIPGVTHAAASAVAPLTNMLYGNHYRVEGFSLDWLQEGASNGSVCCTQTHWVSTDYFSAAGTRLVRGRPFNQADAAGAPKVAIINERLARKFPAGMDPIGHYLTSAEEGKDDGSDRRLIVGIAEDVRDMTVEREGVQSIYQPIEERGEASLTLLLKTSVRPTSIAGAVEQAVQKQAGPVIINRVMSFDDLVLQHLGSRHLNAWLFGSFGVLALLLAAIGIGSVVSYSVARRTREMGLRIALGARPLDVGRLVVRESMIPVAAGLIAGVVAAWMLSHLVADLVYEVQPRDVWTYAAMCTLLLVAALVAATLPARRAARVDPLVALRAE